ncbi:MAG: hypothetical protein ACXWJ5_11700, partial [Xanthobacteraceae bacterium]
RCYADNSTGRRSPLHHREGTAGGYFFATDGHGAPHGAQAPAKSCGDTARPIDGDVMWSAKIAAMPARKTTA